ncbi:MAG TPA: YciI family protein [Rhodothermales bacterium]
MRFVMFVKASPESENGQLPSEEELLEMGRFNEEMANAGVMLGGEGLHPSANGKKVRYDGDRRTVVDGPFTETKELVAGFWLIQTNSWDEALDWAKRVPFREGEVEIRQIFEAEDFGENYTEEVREQEDRIRATMESHQPN